MHTMTRVALFALLLLLSLTRGAQAKADIITCNQQGCSDWVQRVMPRSATSRVAVKHKAHNVRRRSVAVVDANGTPATVRSKSGVAVQVTPAAREALQCIVDYVESAGVKITAMRGYGRGTVRASLHPGGKALDINQTHRDVTSPKVPRSISNAAADRCGVISGARWGYADNGHWNLAVTGQPHEPWPRVLK